MDDQAILERIQRLIEEEHELREHRQQHPLASAELERLQRVEVALDQCWDLLRQRRARRHAGEDPEEAQIRDPSVVERYQQ